MQTSDIMQFRIGNTLRLLLSFVAIVIVLSAGTVWAQNTDTEQSEAKSNASVEAFSNEPAADAANAENASPAYPAGLDPLLILPS